MALQEIFSNGAQTTLSATISTTGATTCTVASSTGFPTPGSNQQFRVLIDSEWIGVTNVSGATWTIVRGLDGSTAATHASGANVYEYVTAAQLGMFSQRSNLATLYGNSLATAVSSIGSTKTTLEITQPTTVSASVTIPTNISLRFADQGMATVNAIPAPGAPSGATQSGTTGVPAGAHTWAITWVTASGETTIGATYTYTVTALSNVTLTIPATPSGATGFNVYRSVAGQSSPLYRIAANQTGTSYVDTTGDGITANSYPTQINQTVVLTINGPVFDPETRQLFAGTGLVQFGQDSVPEIWVEWFGARGDNSGGTSGSGTDNTTPIQAAINSCPAWGGTIRFAGGFYRTTASLNIIGNTTNNYRAAMTLRGQMTGRANVSKQTMIVYDGASTTSPILNLHSLYCRVEGLGFGPSPGRTAAVGIDIDFPAQDNGTSFICTQNVIKECSFLAGAQFGGNTAILVDCIQLGASNNNNMEFMRFEQCDFEGYTHAGLYLNNTTAQSLGHAMEQCNFNANSVTNTYGVYLKSGSMNMRDCNVSQVAIGLYLANTQSMYISGLVSEGAAQLVNQYGGAGGPLIFVGGRLAGNSISSSATTVGQEWIIGQMMSFLGTVFDDGAGQYMRFNVQNLYVQSCYFNETFNPFGNYGSFSASNKWRYTAISNFANDIPMSDTWYNNGGQNSGGGGIGWEAAEHWGSRKITGTIAPTGGFAVSALPAPSIDISSWTMAGTGGSLTIGNGSYLVYWITYVTASGGESQGANQVRITPLFGGVTLSSAITQPASSFQIQSLNGSWGSNNGYIQLAAGQTVSIGGATTDSGLVISSITGTGPYTVNVGTNSITHNHSVSDPVTITSATVTLNNLPLGPAGTTSRKIYRNINNAGSTWLAGTINDNTTTTFTDTGGTGTVVTVPASDATGYLKGKVGALTLDMLQATTATNGTAVTPQVAAGYLYFEYNGNPVKIPYYNI